VDSQEHLATHTKHTPTHQLTGNSHGLAQRPSRVMLSAIIYSTALIFLATDLRLLKPRDGLQLLNSDYAVWLKTEGDTPTICQGRICRITSSTKLKPSKIVYSPIIPRQPAWHPSFCPSSRKTRLPRPCRTLPLFHHHHQSQRQSSSRLPKMPISQALRLYFHQHGLNAPGLPKTSSFTPPRTHISPPAALSRAHPPH